MVPISVLSWRSNSTCWQEQVTFLSVVWMHYLKQHQVNGWLNNNNNNNNNKVYLYCACPYINTIALGMLHLQLQNELRQNAKNNTYIGYNLQGSKNTIVPKKINNNIYHAPHPHPHQTSSMNTNVAYSTHARPNQHTHGRLWCDCWDHVVVPGEGGRVQNSKFRNTS